MRPPASAIQTDVGPIQNIDLYVSPTLGKVWRFRLKARDSQAVHVSLKIKPRKKWHE